MADDWRDPLSGEDDAARERERRRAEREARRRERQEGLGERVRKVREEGSAPEPAAPSRSATPPQRLKPPEPPPAHDPPPPAEPPRATAAGGPPSRGGPPRSTVTRRRVGALVGVAVLAFAAFVVVVAAQRLGGEEAAPAPPPKERKTVSVTIPEGYSRDQVVPVLREAGIEGDYMKATESFKGFDPAEYGAEGAENLEGFLFPATYELFRNADAEDLVAKQLEAFEQNLAGVDLSYAKSKNLNTYDVLKIASMIEREVQVPEERANVSSVIYNRLDSGMPLGIDATIRFEDSNYDEPLLESRLAEDTPYNTRINAGLPPGPIGNPGLDAIEAAADPARNDLLFFVVKPGTCGEHVFTESEDEFLAAEAEYQAALEAEGGSPTEC